MKLKTYLVTRDKDTDAITEEKHISRFPIEKPDGTFEALQADEVKIVEFGYNAMSKQFAVRLQFFGRDISGVLHLDPFNVNRTVNILWDSNMRDVADRNLTLWEKYGIEAVMQAVLDQVEAILLPWFHEQGAVESAMINMYGERRLETKLLDDTNEVAADYRRRPRAAAPDAQ
jgi:hypothetical protein